MIAIIAEIKKKIRHSSEDQLTGDFFGALRYLPFDLGIKPILREGVYPAGLCDCLDGVSLNKWHDNIKFWPHYNHLSRKEPDIVIELEHVAILIEVKYNSPLSGDDQLTYEAELLAELFPKKEKVLLLLAPEDSAFETYAAQKGKIEERKDGVRFGYLTWQKVWAVLRQITPEDPFFKVIVRDLAELLKRKDFGRFHRFEDVEEVDPAGYWVFKEAL